MLELRRVLCPVDFSDFSRRALDHAIAVATWYGSRLRTLVPDAARVCCHVEERVETGRPYRQILRVATEQHAGLIVLGAYGHGALERMFFGSTAQHVVREAVCPVLTLRDPAR